MHAEHELKFLAMRGVPVRIKASNEIDCESNRTTGAIVHIGTDIGGAPFYLDFLPTEIATQHPDAPQVWLAHAHQHVERSGFPGAIGSDQCVNRTAWHIQRQGSK